VSESDLSAPPEELSPRGCTAFGAPPDTNNAIWSSGSGAGGGGVSPRSLTARLGAANCVSNVAELCSASSAFHLSRNYPLILAGGKSMGFKHGRYLNHAGAGAYRGGWAPGDTEPWRMKSTREDLPLSNLYVAMLQKLGVETDSFGGNTGTLNEV